MLDNLCDVPDVLVGHATDLQGITGCTAVLFEGQHGAAVGVDVRGCPPGARAPGPRRTRAAARAGAEAAAGPWGGSAWAGPGGGGVRRIGSGRWGPCGGRTACCL